MVIFYSKLLVYQSLNTPDPPEAVPALQLHQGQANLEESWSAWGHTKIAVP